MSLDYARPRFSPIRQIILFLCTFNNSIAQKNIHSFSVEVFGAQNTIGVN